MTLVLAGFPGVGKSHAFSLLTAMGYKVLDSDSSKFDKEHFPLNYLAHINTVISKGEVNVLFVSSHDTVRDAMDQEGIDYYLVYPALELKEAYLQRYVNRGSPPEFVKLVNDNWIGWITDIEESGMSDDRLICLNDASLSMFDVVTERL